MQNLQRQPLFLKVNTVSEHSQLEVLSIYSATNFMQTEVRTFVEDFHWKLTLLTAELSVRLLLIIWMVASCALIILSFCGEADSGQMRVYSVVNDQCLWLATSHAEVCWQRICMRRNLCIFLPQQPLSHHHSLSPQIFTQQETHSLRILAFASFIHDKSLLKLENCFIFL